MSWGCEGGTPAAAAAAAAAVVCGASWEELYG